MGNCSSGNTIDAYCDHKKPYIAICFADGCSRENGDRRLCEECLVDHTCIEKAAIDDSIIHTNIQVILKDQFQLKGVINKYMSDLKNPQRLKLVNEAIEDLKYNLLESVRSYQLYYQININDFLLQGIPSEMSEVFGEAAKQIVEAQKKNDFGAIGQEGCSILQLTFNNPAILKSIAQGCDTASKRLGQYTSNVEQKLKAWIEQFLRDVKILPFQIQQSVGKTEESMISMANSKFSYGFPSYIRTDDSARSIKMMSATCTEHGERFQVICCDKCTNRDVRLCSKCLLTHKCNATLRVKQKNYNSDQSSVIDVAMTFLKKKNEIDSAKAKIFQMFQELIKQIIVILDELKQNTLNSIQECSMLNVDESIRQVLPQKAQKLQQVFDNRSMASLDSDGVKILAYLIKNTDAKQNLLNYDSSQLAVKFIHLLCSRAEQYGKSMLQNLSIIEEAPIINTNSIINTNNNAGTSMLAQSIRQTQQPIIVSKAGTKPNYKQNNQLEMRIEQAILSKTINDLGEHDDDYISEIQAFQNHLFVSSIQGTINIYDLNTFSLVAQFNLYSKCQCICPFIYNTKLALIASVGNFNEYQISILQLDNGQISKMFQFEEGHSNKIYKIKQFNNYFVTCSGDTTIKVWDITEKKLLKTLTHHTHSVRDILFPNQFTLISCSFDESIQIYDFRTESVTYAINLKEYLYCLQIIDENCFAVGTGDGYLKLFSIESYAELAAFKVSDQYLAQIQLLTNSYLFISSQERENYIVGLHDGKVLRNFMKNEDYENSPEGIAVFKQTLIFGDVVSLKIYNLNE